jgi:hypothetical protein
MDCNNSKVSRDPKNSKVSREPYNSKVTSYFVANQTFRQKTAKTFEMV